MQKDNKEYEYNDVTYSVQSEYKDERNGAEDLKAKIKRLLINEVSDK